MSRITAPLLSFDARGKVGNGVTMQRRKSGPTAIAYSRPTGEPSPAQEAARNAMLWLNSAWAQKTGQLLTIFNNKAAFTIAPNRQLWIGDNIAAANTAEATDLLPGYTTIRRGLEPVSWFFSHNAGNLRFNVVWPTIPDGWVGRHVYIVAWPQQTPRGQFQNPMIGAQAAYPSTAAGAATSLHGITWHAIGGIRTRDPQGNNRNSTAKVQFYLKP